MRQLIWTDWEWQFQIGFALSRLWWSSFYLPAHASRQNLIFFFHYIRHTPKSSPSRARQLDIILENLPGHISRLIIFNGSALKASHHCNVTLEAENINLVLLRSGIFLDIFCTKRNHDPKPQQSREYTAQFNTFSFHLEWLVSFPASIPETTRLKMLAAKLNKVLHRAERGARFVTWFKFPIHISHETRKLKRNIILAKQTFWHNYALRVYALTWTIE